MYFFKVFAFLSIAFVSGPSAFFASTNLIERYLRLRVNGFTIDEMWSLCPHALLVSLALTTFVAFAVATGVTIAQEK